MPIVANDTRFELADYSHQHPAIRINFSIVQLQQLPRLLMLRLQVVVPSNSDLVSLFLEVVEDAAVDSMPLLMDLPEVIHFLDVAD